LHSPLPASSLLYLCLENSKFDCKGVRGLSRADTPKSQHSVVPKIGTRHLAKIYRSIIRLNFHASLFQPRSAETSVEASSAYSPQRLQHLFRTSPTPHPSTDCSGALHHLRSLRDPRCDVLKRLNSSTRQSTYQSRLSNACRTGKTGIDSDNNQCRILG
jgi:hypothetical protein